MKMILAIDGGGSRTRCLAIGCDGVVRSSAESGASNHLLIKMDVVRDSLRDVLGSAIADSGGHDKADVLVSAGLAGVDVDGTGAREMCEMIADLGFPNSVINGDMIIAHAGALAGETGVLALAGTGSCIVGVDEQGRRAKVGGWGPIYGDEGSAYGIGRDALRAAAQSFDGRGPKTALTDAILKKLEIANFAESLETIYLGNSEPRDIASLSRLAFEVAQMGDAIAQNILRKAGEDLSEAAGAAIRRLGLTSPKVSYQGSVLTSCNIVRERFGECINQEFPNAKIVRPRFAPVVGAYLLGRATLRWSADDAVLNALDEQNLTES